MHANSREYGKKVIKNCLKCPLEPTPSHYTHIDCMITYYTVAVDLQEADLPLQVDVYCEL